MDTRLNDLSLALLAAVTATGAGASLDVRGKPHMTFQAVGQTTSGAGAASVDVEVSNNNANWIKLGTIALTLSATAATDGFAALASWGFVRGNVTAISGTGASVTLTIAV